MPKFVPIDETNKQGKQSAEQAGEGSTSEVQKAKDAAEIQKHDTERIKAQREAVFAENDIKDTEDLKTSQSVATEKENKLSKDFMEFENK